MNKPLNDDYILRTMSARLMRREDLLPSTREALAKRAIIDAKVLLGNLVYYRRAGQWAEDDVITTASALLGIK